MTDSDMSHAEALLAAALRYAADGNAVFPVRLYAVAPKEPGGRPTKGVAPIGDWDQASTSDPEQITRWWGPGGEYRGQAIAIDTGKSRLVIADQDTGDGKDGVTEWAKLNPPATWRVRSPTGGYHDYYRADPDHPVSVDARGAVAPGVDIRGNGGFVFAPPTLDPRGGAWRWTEGEPEWDVLPKAPRVLTERMEAAHGNRRPKPGVLPDDTQSSLFQPYGPGAGWKTREEAFELLGRERAAFVAMAGEGNSRSNHLATHLAPIAGHGVGVFWEYDWILEELLDDCVRNGFIGAHRKRYAKNQAENGLEFGMLQLWYVRAEHPEPEDVWPDEEAGEVGAVEVASSNLPPSFWESRESLRLIRQVAHQWTASADAVLGGVLTRIAASVPPEAGPDTGIGNPTSLNLIVALVAESGGGKSSGLSVVNRLMPIDPKTERLMACWDPTLRQLGSGEGIAEAYMGMSTQENIETGKTRQVRKKMRSNVLMNKDEGAELVRMMERDGATVGEALRSAWSGAALGQSNARAETTRVINADTYSWALTIGFQFGIAGRLFASGEVDVGTPQRFLWLSATDPTVPDEVESFTDARLKLVEIGREAMTEQEEFEELWREQTPEGGGLFGERTRPTMRKITIPAAIKTLLRKEKVAKTRGELVVAAEDSHRNLMIVKVSCLLAILDGRTDATEEDWAMAQQVLGVSAVIRRRIQEHAARVEAEAALKRLMAQRSLAKASEQGRQEQADACKPGHVELIVRKLSEAGTPMAKTGMKAFFKHRHCLDDVLGQLVADGVLKLDGRQYSLT